MAATVTLNRDEYDVIISVPVESVVVTSTTHIPALEALGVLDRLVGFPETRYISSPAARERIGEGHIKDLGSNESINTEMVLELQPELVVGFAVGERNKAYDLLQRSSIPVVYNGDWTEESPLGKAEWIKFFAPFFGLEQKADSLFRDIEVNYMEAMELAENSEDFPTVLSGALYKDIWYLPGGSSWAARFLEDANAAYLWNDNGDIGSLSLSVEHVLERGADADYWISPSQYTSYAEMEPPLQAIQGLQGPKGLYLCQDQGSHRWLPVLRTGAQQARPRAQGPGPYPAPRAAARVPTLFL